MTNTISLDAKYSTTKLLTKEKPVGCGEEVYWTVWGYIVNRISVPGMLINNPPHVDYSI